MAFNEYRLQQYIKKTNETVSDTKDGAVRRMLRNFFYRIYPVQSLFNKNVADSLSEIFEYIHNVQSSNGNNIAEAKEQKIFDQHEVQIEELRTQIIQLRQEVEVLRRENESLKASTGDK